MRALGLMSGTSMDGVDAAVLETDGETIAGFGPSAFRALCAGGAGGAARRASGAGRATRGSRRSRRWCGAAHAAAVAGFDGVEVVGFHGQTLAHEPRGRGTHQVGRGDLAGAGRAGVPVVWDFRTADVASGGEGAPLVPFFHFACARWIGAEAPVAFLNLGGVGNVTWVDPRAAAPEAAGALVAFDTGPGNALIDDFLAAAAGAGLRRGRRGGGGGAGGRGGAGRAGGASVPAQAAAEVAGPAGFPRLSRPGGAALDRGRGGDAGGADGGLRRGGGAAFSRAAGRAGWSAAAGGGTGR